MNTAFTNIAILGLIIGIIIIRLIANGNGAKSRVSACKAGSSMEQN